MGMTLSEDLRPILEFVGIDWPDIDEDDLTDAAREYREFADGILDTIQKGNRACSHVTAGRSKGKAVDAFGQRWGKLSGHDMRALATAANLLADTAEAASTYVVSAKIAVYTELASAAAAVGVATAAAFFTVGLSELLGAAAVAALRLAVKLAVDELIDYLTQLAVETISGEVKELLEKAFDKQFSSGGVDGKGNLLPSGSASTAQDLVIVFDEFDQAINDLEKTRGSHAEKKEKHKAGKSKRGFIAKKDDRFRKFGEAVSEAEDLLEKKAHQLEKEIDDVAKKAKKNRDNHKDNEDKNKKDIDKCGDQGDTPMYLLGKDGTVQSLTPDGQLHKVSPNDNSGIHDLLESDGKAWRPSNRAEREKYSTPGGHQKKVSSTKVDPYSDDLGQATQAARYARNDYSGNNYAAGRYVDPDTGKEIVLVGYSEGSMHSERSIGYPLLNKGKGAGLQEVFTEREPCQKRPSCDRWLDQHFASKNPNLTVHHTAEYDQTEKNGTKRNKEHGDYISGLRKFHGR